MKTILSSIDLSNIIVGKRGKITEDSQEWCLVPLCQRYNDIFLINFVVKGTFLIFVVQIRDVFFENDTTLKEWDPIFLNFSNCLSMIFRVIHRKRTFLIYVGNFPMINLKTANYYIERTKSKTSKFHQLLIDDF